MTSSEEAPSPNTANADTSKKPNVLLVVSDQERQRDWLPADFPLPHRQRLIDAGLEFTNHYTHTTPCSPARASLFTGQYTAGHGVTENSTAGHLDSTPTPDMDAPISSTTNI